MSVLPMIVSSQLGKEVECKSHLDCFTLLAMTNLTVSNRGGEVGSGVAAPYLPPLFILSPCHCERSETIFYQN
jgi:hypothetical protein